MQHDAFCEGPLFVLLTSQLPAMRVMNASDCQSMQRHAISPEQAWLVPPFVVLTSKHAMLHLMLQPTLRPGTWLYQAA